MDEHWSSSPELHLFTDAALKGIGAVFSEKWMMDSLSKEEIGRSIAWKELFAVVMACAMWGEHFRSRKLVIHSDNISIVFAVNTGTSKCADMMYLIRQLYHLCVQYNFECTLQHVPGVLNVSADALSRGMMAKFHSVNPSASCNMSDPKIARARIKVAGTQRPGSTLRPSRTVPSGSHPIQT